MHRAWPALSQVKALSRVRPGSGIPSISTAHAQAQCCCAQVIHMFVHSQQVSSPLGAGRQQPISARCLRDRASRSDAGLPARRDEIMQERGPRMPWVRAAAGIRGFRAYCLRSRRCCVGTSPVLPAVNRVIAAGIQAVAGVPVLEGDVPAGQNQTRPPMYEMGGLVRPRRARRGQLPGFAGAARPAGARYPCEGPVSRLLARSPGVAPKVVPVSDGESISTASVNAAQEPEVNYLWFLRYPHGIHRRMQFSAPDGGYPPANSQTVHK